MKRCPVCLETNQEDGKCPSCDKELVEYDESVPAATKKPVLKKKKKYL